jgi:hypothetical protein
MGARWRRRRQRPTCFGINQDVFGSEVVCFFGVMMQAAGDEMKKAAAILRTPFLENNSQSSSVVKTKIVSNNLALNKSL